MRTTVDLPQDLLATALELSHAKSKREVMTVALQEYVKRLMREEFLLMLENGAIDLTLEDLERMRADD
jgi:Arc/MetJ family transcription regulator